MTRGTLKAVRIPALVLLLALVLVAVANTALPAPAIAVGTVAPLNAWPSTPQMTGTTGNLTGTFAVSDGINRLLLVLVCGYDAGSSSGQTFAATYGGKALTQAYLQNSNEYQTWVGYLNEANIASRTDNAVTVTVTGTHTQVRGYIASYSGVDQTTPVTASGGTYVNNTNGVAIGGPLAVNAGGYGIYGWSSYAVRTRTSDNEGYTELSDVDNALNPNYGVAAKAFAGAGTTNPIVTWSGANYASVSFITLNPDSTYPPPTTTSISPTTKTEGDAEFTLTVNGTNFVSGVSVVHLDGADRTTAFVSSTQLTATILASDLTAAGGKTITVFTPTPGGGTSNAQTLSVKAVPTITWANPADIVYGTTLSSTQLCAAASVPGTFVYSPDVGALLLAGDSQTLHVDFTPTDTATYYSTSADVTINVDKATLIITANNINKTYGAGATFAGTEFAADGLVNDDTVTSVTLASTGAGVTATVDNSPYSIVPSAAVGTGLSNYNITYVDGSLTVEPRALTITANNLSKIYRAAATFIGTGFTADGLVNGDTVASVTLASAGAAADARVDGSPYPIVPSAAIGTGLSNYSIIYVNGSLTVNKATVGLSFDSSASTSTKGRSVTFTATFTDTGATGTVTFQDGETMLGSSTVVDGMATYTVSTLTAGRHSITAVYSGDANFAGSTSSALDLTVKRVAGSYWWAMIGGLIALDVLLGLLLGVLILRRRRKHLSGANAISGATGVAVGAAGKNHGGADPDLADRAVLATLAAEDVLSSHIGLPTVEEVGTYSIQLERELEKSMKKAEKSIEAAIQAVCRTVETKDPYVAGHQKRVSQLACTIGKEMGLTDWQIEGIRVAGLLHDIGKITVPTEILSKPGRLSAIEVTMIKDHPKVAFDILKNIEFDWPIARIVVQHHERLDGSGYPHGIPGEEILLEAKILAVADVVEAMSSDRPYRPARGIEEALAELARGAGTLYDPEVVRACAKVVNERGFKVELTSSHS